MAYNYLNKGDGDKEDEKSTDSEQVDSQYQTTSTESSKKKGLNIVGIIAITAGVVFLLMLVIFGIVGFFAYDKFIKNPLTVGDEKMGELVLDDKIEPSVFNNNGVGLHSKKVAIEMANQRRLVANEKNAIEVELRKEKEPQIQRDQGADKIHVNWLSAIENLDEVPADRQCPEILMAKERAAGFGYNRCALVGIITAGDERFVGNNLYGGAYNAPGGYFMEYAVLYKIGKKPVHFIFNQKFAPIAGIDDIATTLKVSGIEMEFISKNKNKEWFHTLKADGVGSIIEQHPSLGNIYKFNKDCLAVKLKDHTIKAYEFDIEFVSDETRIPKIVFNNGEENTGTYEYEKHTCGGVCKEYVHNDEVTIADLQQIGKASNGEVIYSLKKDDNVILKDLYNNKNTVAYFGEDWSEKLDENKYTYEEYINMHPFLYWKNPFGKLVQFTNEKFTVAAEMCKPVVYFYTEDEKDLHFDVEPVGGFTHTEPVHNNGWDIKTIGEGRIVDNKTGKEYDSLLWEGMALGYETSEKGWVIKTDKLNSFFDEKLSELGMNKKEISDFKEYWLERMSDYLYYRISFMDRQQFDKLAPLSFSEEPDNILRIMMITNGEDSYYNLQPQTINTNISRDGFTVVEWGGMLER